MAICKCTVTYGISEGVTGSEGGGGRLIRVGTLDILDGITEARDYAEVAVDSIGFSLVVTECVVLYVHSYKECDGVAESKVTDPDWRKII
jgi:hypothetical protein